MPSPSAPPMQPQPQPQPQPAHEQPNLVIKVKYGNTLRRFGAHVHGQSMDQDMCKLRAKIVNVFKFSPGDVFTLTYVDEDGDAVTLDDDEELHDAVINQLLNPLRINVQLKTCESSDPNSQIASLSPESTSRPLELDSAVENALKSFPKPLRHALPKLSHGLESIVASSAASPAEVAEYSKLLSNVNQPSHGPGGSQDMSGVPLASLIDTEFSDKAKTSVDPVTATTLLGTANYVNPDPTKPNEMVNKIQSSRTGTSTSVDLNMDLHINDLLSCSWTTNYKKELEKGGGGAPGGMALPASSADEPVGRIAPCFVAPNSATSEFRYSQSDVRYKGALTYSTNIPFPRKPHSYHATCHRGVQCDGCGMFPIMGPRFKSKVKEDYDLCNICFSEMGDANLYTRIERAQSRRLLKELYNRHSRRGPPSRLIGCGMRSSARRHEGLGVIQSVFIKDITVTDGTVMLPSTPFTKIWRMRNNGTIAWPVGTQLLWTGGHQLGSRRSAQLVIPSGSFPVGGEIDIAVDLASPSEPGWYTSYWRLVSADGLLFGEPVWAQIQVENPQPSSAVTTGFHGDINLNLPFESSGLSELGIVDMNAETAGAACAQPNLTTSEPESFLDATPSASVEPVKQDSFLGASYGNAQLPPDLITLVTPETSSKASTATDIPECVAAVGENPVEQWLLKELEEMGFEHLDLNKDILRQNEYNLERCVDELCGSTGWDVLLEELKELGFADEEINKKMLVKNGGSIKRVVLDLIAEEKHG